MGMRQMIRQASMREAIETGYDLALEKGTPDVLLYSRLNQAFDKGLPVARVLKDFLPAEEALIIQSGEQSEDPSQPYDVASRFLVSLADVRRGVRGSIIQALTWFGMVAAVLFIVLPILIGGMQSAVHALPGLVESSPDLEKYLASYEVLKILLPVLFGMVALFFLISATVLGRWRIRPISPSALSSLRRLSGFRRWLRKTSGSWRQWSDRKMQPFKTYRETKAIGVLYSVSSLMQAGVPLPRAFGDMQQLANPYLKDYLEIMQERADRGLGPAEVFDVPLFSLMSRVQLAKFAGGGKSAADSISFVAQNESEVMTMRTNRLKSRIAFIGAVLGAAGLIYALSAMYLLFMAINDYRHLLS